MDVKGQEITRRECSGPARRPDLVTRMSAAICYDNRLAYVHAYSCGLCFYIGIDQGCLGTGTQNHSRAALSQFRSRKSIAVTRQCRVTTEYEAFSLHARPRPRLAREIASPAARGCPFWEGRGSGKKKPLTRAEPSCPQPTPRAPPLPTKRRWVLRARAVSAGAMRVTRTRKRPS